MILGFENESIPILLLDMNKVMLWSNDIAIFKSPLVNGIIKLISDNGNIIALTKGIRIMFRIIEKIFTW